MQRAPPTSMKLLVTIDRPGRAAALDLTAAGWAVLPLDGKIPRTRHGVKDASTDPDTVRGWWPPNSTHNIGARLPSGLLVLDFDPQNGGSVAALELVLELPLPVTLMVHSGRGEGSQHRYYRHPGGHVSSTRLPPGIDVKTSTGYCVVPPSIHPTTGRPYRWEPHPVAEMPPTLVALLRPKSSPRTQTEPAQLSSTRAEAKAAALERVVLGAAEGRRNELVYWAAATATREGLGSAALDRISAAGTAVGLSEREARRTIASAQRAAGYS